MNCEKQSVMMTFAYGGLSDMDIEKLRQAAIDQRFILSANPDWREGRACGLTDDKTEQKANDALTIILDNIEELVVAYLIDPRQSVKSDIGETSDKRSTKEIIEKETQDDQDAV